MDQLDFVILSALEIDTNFNVNVLTAVRFDREADQKTELVRVREALRQEINAPEQV